MRHPPHRPIPLLLAALLAGCAAPAPRAAPPGRIAGLLAEVQALPTGAREAKLAALRESPFRFFRGAADLFWADLGQDPRLERFGGEARAATWIQGDAHPENVGTFGDEPAVAYDLNDFDEAVVADYQLDVWRMAIGIELAARAQGLAPDARRRILDAFATAYAQALGAPPAADPEAALEGPLAKLVAKVARKRTRARMLEAWTTVGEGGRALNVASEPRLEAVDAARTEALTRALADYAARLDGIDAAWLVVKSVARRLEAGTGSLGTDRYYALVEGPTTADDDDVLLDLKLQGAPGGWAALTAASRARLVGAFPLPAQRVAAAERALLGARASPLTGWLRLGDASYSVRPRSPRKDDLALEELTDAEAFTQVARAWGRILAAAHARGAATPPAAADVAAIHDRLSADPQGFAALVGEVARTYADQTEADHAAFCAAAPER